jgi:hypothetical protein
MRTLRNYLQDQDLGFLRIIAELWGFDPPQGSVRDEASELADRMLEPQLLEEIIGALPRETSEALFELVNLGGSTPWHSWARRYGHVRVMGPSRRDRDKPWRGTTSPSEALWYRGLLGRAFVDTPKGPEEYAYLPIEVHQQLESSPQMAPSPYLEPISPPNDRFEAAATIIDDCTTVLAALRRQSKNSVENALPLLASQLIQLDSLNLCLALMQDIGLLRTGSFETDLTAVRDFLLADRMLSLQQLYTSWKNSILWNDLSALTTLQAGGDEWPNDPLLPRETLLRWIKQLQMGEWYALSDLVRAIYEEDPAFQRPGGNFDTWYIHDAEGVPLDGINHWYAVEGALLRSLLKGPLRWFGIVQLGRDPDHGPVSSFSPTKLFKLLESTHTNFPAVKEKGKAIIRSDGSVTIPRLAPRSVRYQLARFLEWEGQSDQNYHYRLSIRAVNRAQQQGLQFDQVRSILTQASESEIPPAVLQSMQRLEDHAYKANIEQYHLLRLSDPSLLESLLSNASTKRFIQERLSETTAIVRQKHWIKLARAAVSLGILIDGPTD